MKARWAWLESPSMEGSAFDEVELFRAIARSGARAVLIGRKALVVLGLPVLTADYDFWIHADDAAAFNGALAGLGLRPSHAPEEARKRGRYVLENDEKVDVLVARAISTIDGRELAFEQLWARRRSLTVAEGVSVTLPTLDDLIATKRIAPRPKDAEDVRLLEGLRRREGGKE